MVKRLHRLVLLSWDRLSRRHENFYAATLKPPLMKMHEIFEKKEKE